MTKSDVKKVPVKEPEKTLLTFEKLQLLVVIGLFGAMWLEFGLLLYDKQWFNSALLAAIMLVIAAPIFVARGLSLQVPIELQLPAVIFTFAALFLGEMRSFYDRFWWWDILLHATSGILVGLLGFLLVYILNEDDEIDVHMHPSFVAIFAFVFALAIGTLWELFEFQMDYFFGSNMQKPMLGDQSGLTDTMWDMIVNAIGAFIVSFFGWRYMKTSKKPFVDRWLSKLLTRNPNLFMRGRGARRTQDRKD